MACQGIFPDEGGMAGTVPMACHLACHFMPCPHPYDWPTDTDPRNALPRAVLVKLDYYMVRLY